MPDPTEDPLVQRACEIESAVKLGKYTDPGPAAEATEPAEIELHLAAKAIRFLDAVRKARESQMAGSTPFAMDTPGIAHSTTPIVHSSSADSATKTIGRFEIIKELGRGGFATVYLARDPRLNRNVALKLPSPSALVNAEAQARFDREARAAAVLSHPAIVPVFESGNVGPISFITYEFCDGPTLKAWMAAAPGPLDPHTAARIVRRLSEAVHHAHQRGIVHRDLKPQNILVDSRGGPDGNHAHTVADCVRITDFGLAKHPGNMDQMLTAEGAVVGTPAYMSPEQAVGSQEINEASDIYSLGVILYELLTGKLPLVKSNPVATLRAIESEIPPSPRQVEPDVSRDLSAICMRCLEKKPLDRYLSAYELEADLDRWLNGRQVHARPVGWFSRQWKLMQRNPLVSSAVIFAILSLTVGLCATLWKWREANANFHTAEKAKSTANQNLVLAQETVDQLVNDVVRNPHLPAAQRKEMVMRSVTLQEQLLEAAPRDTEVLYKTAMAYHQLAALSLFDLEAPQDALAAIKKAQHLLGRIEDQTITNVIDRTEQFKVKQRLIELEIDPGQYQKLNTPEEPGRNWYMIGQKHHIEATAAFNAGDYDAALLQARLGLQWMAKVPVSNPFAADMRARLQILASNCLVELGQPQTARKTINQCLESPVIAELVEVAGNEDYTSPDHLIMLDHIARSLQIRASTSIHLNQDPTGDLAKSENIYRKVFASDESPHQARALVRCKRLLVEYQIKQGNLLEAERVRDEELRPTLAKHHDHLVNEPSNLATVTMLFLDLAEAEYTAGNDHLGDENIDLANQWLALLEDEDLASACQHRLELISANRAARER